MDHIIPTSSIVKQPRLAAISPASPGKGADRLAGATELRRLRRACQDFESIFVYTLLKTMRQSLPKPEGAGASREIYTSIGDLEVARSVAQGQGIGLGDLLFRQLLPKVR